MKNDHKADCWEVTGFCPDIQNCMPEHLKVRREVHDGWQSMGGAVQFAKPHEKPAYVQS